MPIIYFEIFNIEENYRSKRKVAKRVDNNNGNFLVEFIDERKIERRGEDKNSTNDYPGFPCVFFALETRSKRRAIPKSADLYLILLARSGRTEGN